ncbi:MAG TPA: polyprenyl synthetase family protein [Bacteroidales bacterium]
MTNLSSIRLPVEKEIAAFEKHFSDSLDTQIPLLDTITNYLLRQKGKQIRPLFVFLTAKTLAEPTESTFHAATFIELLHTATLIHDDVVDESYQRRNHFSINAIWKSKVAVLVGDYFLSKGLLLSVKHKEFELLEAISQAVREMSEGELMQIQTSKKSILKVENYFEIIRKKTASLIASCCACGAISVKADEQTIEKMRQFGFYIGSAFQIKDDLLDYQEKDLIGKPKGNDIKEKKYTLPFILAVQNNQKEKNRILRLFNQSHKPTETIEEISKFVIDNNGIADSIKYMNEFRSKALDILSEFPDNEAKKSLILLVDYIIERKH